MKIIRVLDNFPTPLRGKTWGELFQRARRMMEKYMNAVYKIFKTFETMPNS